MNLEWNSLELSWLKNFEESPDPINNESGPWTSFVSRCLEAGRNPVQGRSHQGSIGNSLLRRFVVLGKAFRD